MWCSGLRPSDKGDCVLELFYFRHPAGNFGDDLNAWIWDALLPGWHSWTTAATLIGVGTILNTELPLPEGRKLVVGSGTGYGRIPDVTNPAQWDLRALRGPLSAERLGVPRDVGIVDPAMMLPRLPEFADIPRSGTQPLFVPHLSGATRHDWPRVCRRAGLRYVSPCGEARAVIEEIARAPLVLAESLHAAIIADAFRTPWIAVSVSNLINRDKWADWAASLGIALEFHELFPEFTHLRRALRATPAPAGTAPGAAPGAPPRSRARRAKLALRLRAERPLIARRLRKAATASPTLSDPATLRQRQDRYQAVLDGVIRDYRG